MKIGDRVIDDDSPPYVIAEIGNNHGGGGNLDAVIDLIVAASEAGADAVKFQRRTIDKFYSKEQLNAPYDNPNSFGKTYGEHRKWLELSLDDLRFCADLAATKHMDFLCTAFDPWAADDIKDLVPAWKVASASITDYALMAKMKETPKPFIVSTGGARREDIPQVCSVLRGHEVAFLQCTAIYPCPSEKINLRGIEWLKSVTDVVGYSGHDTGIAIPLAAYVMGARIIEKHFTLDRSAKGTDHAMSLEPQGLRTLVENLKKVHAAMGQREPIVYDEEQPALAKMRRRL